ncbi:LacI family DNA-binding transcriptional regulator [Cerasicoccus fimbriatus]|uniref:LacI family DNA-binding transcriptional regulator n=1 Tax=Cerasicoccus fimbriatus TaxID=3014554 RepID=UPI0022B44249|nr:LacI family DNA-binding transcriptional regulator [Cerasicoccus sp. TK19100]
MNIRELARLAGVSKTTAAYAVKNDQRISESVRQRIQALAKVNGYNPNPLVKAYMQEMRKGKVEKSRQYSLCYLSSLDPISGKPRHVKYLFEQDIIAGASFEAEKLGYPFEVIICDPGQMSRARLSQIIFSRGIRGLLIGPSGQAYTKLDLDWSSVAAIAYGHSVVKPELSRFNSNYQKAILDFADRAFARKYQTIIFAFEQDTDKRAERRWLSAASALQAIHGRQKIKFKVDDYRNLPGYILGQLSKSKAPVIMGPSGLLEELRQHGVLIPEDVGFVANDDEHPNTTTAISQPNYIIGRLAIDQLSMLVECGRWGPPEIPCTQTIDCGWHEGETLPSR